MTVRKVWLGGLALALCLCALVLTGGARQSYFRERRGYRSERA